MRGKKPDPDIRASYQWRRSPGTVRTEWIETEYSTDDTVTPSRVQQETDGSRWHLYRQLVTIRECHPALRTSGRRPDGQHVPFARDPQCSGLGDGGECARSFIRL